jgi:hypothetical protein
MREQISSRVSFTSRGGGDSETVVVDMAEPLHPDLSFQIIIIIIGLVENQR